MLGEYLKDPSSLIPKGRRFEMSRKKKTLLYVLIGIGTALCLFVLFHQLSLHLFHKPSLLLSPVLAILTAALLVSLLLNISAAKRLTSLSRDLDMLHEGSLGELSLQPSDEGEDLSRAIRGIARQLRESEQKHEILLEITQTVSSRLHLQEVLDAIVELLTRQFRLDACSIRLLDRDGNLRITSQMGLSEKFVETATRKPTPDSYSGECFLTGKMVIINDAEKIDKPISTTLLVGENIQSFAVTPIKAEGTIIGVLVSSSRKKNYFHERFNDLINIIANQIGTAIRISQLYDKIYTVSQGLEKMVQERTQELDEKSKQLIEAQRLAALGKMADRVADECRNSLTIIGGFARRLYEKTPEDDPQKRDLKLIVEQVMVLEDRVSRIVDFEREEKKGHC
jgi:nitrate/nitrite-specific signal transduction histidine kinase